MSEIQSGGENVDWFRVFEGMKSIQKDHYVREGDTSSSSAPFSIVPLDNSANDDQISTHTHIILDNQLIQYSLDGNSKQQIHLDPVKVFLSTTIEPSLKKRKLLVDDPSGDDISSSSISVSNGDIEEEDPLEKYVTSYMNSKPFGM